MTLTAFHAHSVPPSPLSASYLSQRKPQLESSSYAFPSPSTASQVSRIGEEPVSRFSDWGTSIEGSGSRNPSSEDLSDDEEGGGGGGSVTDLTGPESKVITTHRGHITISETLSRSSSPSSSPPPPSPTRHRSAPATTDLQHRPHLLHHHHHSTHSHLPRESRVADSSYPELAVAFFTSVKKFKERKLERRASTGSLGGAV